jgi:hypothetical protein
LLLKVDPSNLRTGLLSETLPEDLAGIFWPIFRTPAVKRLSISLFAFPRVFAVVVRSTRIQSHTDAFCGSIRSIDCVGDQELEVFPKENMHCLIDLRSIQLMIF